MIDLVLAAGVPVPSALADAAPVTETDAVPSAAQIDPHLPASGRIVVVGADAALAAVVTRLLRRDRLGVEVAFVGTPGSAAAASLGLPTGAAAVRVAHAGTARPAPLIRDDTGVAVIGHARLTGPLGVAGDDEVAGPLVGEAYVDDTLLFSGEIRRAEIRPTAAPPGLRARAVLPGRRWCGGRRATDWIAGRAIQFGMVAGTLTRDGIPHKRTLKRSTLYRHTEDWMPVLP